MQSYHFFERMEREIDWRHEYEKVEEMVCNERITSSGTQLHFSLNRWISDNFLSWSDRRNYSSFNELRKALGFEIGLLTPGHFSAEDKFRPFTMTDFFLYAEMLTNIVYSLLRAKRTPSEYGFINQEDIIEGWMEKISHIFNYDVEKAGFCFNVLSGKTIIIIQKDAAASVVADHEPAGIADNIIEYNHYTIKGDIPRKKELLKAIADALEPRRKDLKGLNVTLENDFFHLVNSCNIRHNNTDPADLQKYKPGFAAFTNEEKENAYDLIYEESLMYFMTLEQLERKKDIDILKTKI